MSYVESLSYSFPFLSSQSPSSLFFHLTAQSRLPFTAIFILFIHPFFLPFQKQMLLSHDAMEINHAPNPNDIIWENVSIPKSQVFVSGCLWTTYSVRNWLVERILSLLHLLPFVFHHRYSQKRLKYPRNDKYDVILHSYCYHSSPFLFHLLHCA